MEVNNLEILKFIILAVLTVGTTYLAFKADNRKHPKIKH